MNPQQLSSQPLILCGTGALQAISTLLEEASYDRIFLHCDTNTRSFCLPILQAQVPVLSNVHLIESQPGEAHKNLETLAQLTSQLLEAGAGRKSLLINIGGGLVGDLGGFAAAIYMRGIDFIQVPTTLLAMVDASVGGKTAINFEGKKNLLGAFQEPKAVFIDPVFLPTLPKEELLSGYAEIIKHALLDGFESTHAILENDPLHRGNWDALIAKSVVQKKRITDEDFRESGLREQLNLGHTVAHAMEALALERAQFFPHGYAVAAGICVEVYLSKQLGLLKDGGWKDELFSYIHRLYPAFEFEENDVNRLCDLMLSDKKNQQGQRSFSLLIQPGQVQLGVQASLAHIQQALNEYQVYARRS
ncbi:MAG: hypothetical protein RLZZ543_1379 [Bacteroidota bacterium]|jgi:3-dehydroquinate synthase